MSEGEGMIVQQPDAEQPLSGSDEPTGDDYLLRGGLGNLEGPGIAEDTSKPRRNKEDQQ